MSSTEFWEEDPQLYWAYRIFYLKQQETTQILEKNRIEYNSWLNGNMTYMGVNIALYNSFNKGEKIEFPSFDETFNKENKNSTKKMKSKKEKQLIVQEEFNKWARI